jgi:hypothetical protein
MTRSLRVTAAALITLLAVVTDAPSTAAADSRLGSPLPSLPVVAQGVSSANPAHLFRDHEWDFRAMRQVFNTVSLLPGDPKAVDAARRAGLAVVLEFDYKADFFAGRDITVKVRRVADQIRQHSGTVAAIHVADRLNEKYSAGEGLRYLAATGGLLHRLVPGVPVLVNAADWQLTCGLPGQASCGSHGKRFQYETDATLDSFRSGGYVDGLSIANNLKNFDAAVQERAWRRARDRWATPFLLWTTCSQLSFGAARYNGSPPAEAAVDAYMRAPSRGGADGIALWAWHQLYRDEVDTFLDKDGSSNALWMAMREAAGQLTRPQGSGVASSGVTGPGLTQPSHASTSSRWIVVSVSTLTLLVAIGAVIAIRAGQQRRRSRYPSPPGSRTPHRRVNG